MLILGPKLRKEFKMKDIKTVFTSGTSLKSKLLHNYYLSVYALNCSFNAELIDEIKKKCNDQNNSIPTRRRKQKIGKFRCDGKLFKRPWSIQSVTCKDITQRNKIQKQKNTGELLKIKGSKCKNGKSHLNRDDGNLAKINRTKSMLRGINNQESTIRNQRSHYKTNLTSNQLL